MSLEKFNFSMQELLSSFNNEKISISKDINFNLSPVSQNIIAEILKKDKYNDFIQLAKIPEMEAALFESKKKFGLKQVLQILLFSIVTFFMCHYFSFEESNIIITMLLSVIAFCYLVNENVKEKRGSAIHKMKSIIGKRYAYLENENFFNMITYAYFNSQSNSNNLAVVVKNVESMAQQEWLRWEHMDFNQMLERFYHNKNIKSIVLSTSPTDKEQVIKDLTGFLRQTEELRKKNERSEKCLEED